MQSVNQVRQLYVAKGHSTVVPTGTDEKGYVSVRPSKEGANTVGILIQHLGEGGLVTSDLIKKGQIISAKATPASKMAKTLKQAVLELDATVNGGAPIAGQDYIVDVQVSNYVTLADESVLVKFAAVHATSNMTASDFYKTLAKSFARNLSRDINKFFKVYLTTEASAKGTVSTSWEEVTVTSAHTGTAYTGVVISELAQTEDYVLGEAPVRTVNFKVFPHTVIFDGDETQAMVVAPDETGTVKLMPKVATTVDAVTTIANGYDIADLEWFCMGERGDIYRQMGYPRTIRTKYMVDPTAAYNVLDIEFYFQGRGVDVQKSEKLLTVVAENSDVLNDLINQINEELGTSIATL